MFGDASKVVVAKGKKTLVFQPKKSEFDVEELRSAVIGPSGNLRAPAIRTGKTWHVGFHADAYAEHFGG